MALKASENDWAVEELIIGRQRIGAHTQIKQANWKTIEKPYDKTKSSMWPHICVGLASNWVKTPQDLEKL